MPSPFKKSTPVLPKAEKKPAPVLAKKPAPVLAKKGAPAFIKKAAPKVNQDVLALLRRRQLQFLVHSFVYYQLNESLIDDATYDRWCKELVDLQKAHPEVAEELPFTYLCKGVDGAASGFYLRVHDYPESILSTGFHLVATAKKVAVSALIAQYPDFHLKKGS